MPQNTGLDVDMVKFQVRLRPSQLAALKALAAQRHTSVAALIRQALDEWRRLDGTAGDGEARRRAIAIAGRFNSGRTDLSVAHDRYLAEAFDQ
jgi:hypothetical protein